MPTMTQGVFFAHHGLPFDQILSVICSQGEIWYTPLIDDWGDSALFLEVQCSFSTNSSFICLNTNKILLSNYNDGCCHSDEKFRSLVVGKGEIFYGVFMLDFIIIVLVRVDVPLLVVGVWE